MSNTIIQCSKEKEIAIMTIKIENIEKLSEETKVDGKETKLKVEAVHDTLLKFIAKADEKYVTKKQLAWLIPILCFSLIGVLTVNHLV